MTGDEHASSASSSTASQADELHDNAAFAFCADKQPAQTPPHTPIADNAVSSFATHSASPAIVSGNDEAQCRPAPTSETTSSSSSQPRGAAGWLSWAATGAQAGAAVIEWMTRRAISFEELRRRAKGGDKAAAKLINWLKHGGGGDRNLDDMQALYEKIPVDSRSSLEGMEQFLDDKSVSHVIPQSKFAEETGGSQRAAGRANNIEIETIEANRARGDERMTWTERTAIRMKNNFAPVAKAGAISAAIGCTVSSISHVRRYRNGDETGAQAVAEVAKDTAVAGATGFATAAVCIMCPPVATVMTAYAVSSLAAKSVYSASNYLAPELTKSTEQAVVKIANDTGITTAVTYVNDAADSVASAASKCVDGAKDAARSAARARLPTSLTTFMFGAESSPAGSAPTTDGSASPPLDADGEISISCEDDDDLSAHHDGEDESNSETVVLLLPDGPIVGTDDNVTTSATAHVASGAVINSMIPGSQHPPILLHPLHPGDGSGPIVL